MALHVASGAQTDAGFPRRAEKGRQVITAGDIYSTVKEIKETTLLIEVDGNVTLRIDKNMVVADSSDLQRPVNEIRRKSCKFCGFFVLSVRNLSYICATTGAIEGDPQ